MSITKLMEDKMSEDDFIDNLNKEMKKVTTLCEFLIVQPSLIETLIGNEREKIMVQNLLRVKCCNLWAENMVQELEKKCSEESLKAIGELFKMVEVNRKEKDKKSSPKQELKSKIIGK
jgi:hypothetical protein